MNVKKVNSQRNIQSNISSMYNKKLKNNSLISPNKISPIKILNSSKQIIKNKKEKTLLNLKNFPITKRKNSKTSNNSIKKSELNSFLDTSNKNSFINSNNHLTYSIIKNTNKKNNINKDLDKINQNKYSSYIKRDYLKNNNVIKNTLFFETKPNNNYIINNFNHNNITHTFKKKKINFINIKITNSNSNNNNNSKISKRKNSSSNNYLYDTLFSSKNSTEKKNETADNIYHNNVLSINSDYTNSNNNNNNNGNSILNENNLKSNSMTILPDTSNFFNKKTIYSAFVSNEKILNKNLNKNHFELLLDISNDYSNKNNNNNNNNVNNNNDINNDLNNNYNNLNIENILNDMKETEKSNISESNFFNYELGNIKNFSSNLQDLSSMQISILKKTNPTGNTTNVNTLNEKEFNLSNLNINNNLSLLHKNNNIINNTNNNNNFIDSTIINNENSVYFGDTSELKDGEILGKIYCMNINSSQHWNLLNNNNNIIYNGNGSLFRQSNFNNNFNNLTQQKYINFNQPKKNNFILKKNGMNNNN